MPCTTSTANADALDAVLADPRAANPDAVLVGGDTVPGPFACAVLDRLAAVRFVNAGSVGFPCEGDGVARWLRVSDGVPQPGSTSYDAAAAGARMLEAGWPDEDSVRAALIEPVAAQVVTDLFERQARG